MVLGCSIQKQEHSEELVIFVRLAQETDGLEAVFLFRALKLI